MLKTPIEHLPRYYPGGLSWAPEWSKAEHDRYQPIWARAFQIHEKAHVYGEESPDFCLWVINPLETLKQGIPTCDCYERAYQEFKKAGKLTELGIGLQTEALAPPTP